MANEIKLKRGSGSDPGSSDLVVGEIAIRTDTGKLFTKKDNGSVAEISGSGGIDDGDKGDITVSNGGDTFTIDNGVVTSAKIADGTIVNADINASAAIDGSKIQTAGIVNAGVMTAAQHNKLAGIESNATADMTGSEILSTISGENIILGEISSTGNSTFAGNVTISSSDGGSSAAPEIDLYRISASPADADYLGQIKFSGESDDDSKEVYAKITGKIGDASSGTEDGIIEIAHTKAGSNNISARFTSTDLKLINGTGLEVAGNISCDGHIDLADASQIKLGDSDEFIIQHTSGGASLISETGSGNLDISATNIQLKDASGNNKLQTNGSGVAVTGNITVSGTVDGRDVATDGTKLDGIESGATADQSASEILTLLKTVDGAGSGLNADTLDGISSASFLRSDATDTCSGQISFSSEIRFGQSYSDPDNGVQRDAKFGDNGIAVVGGIKTDTLNATGNITVSGTVDGRDVATDGTKLDGIASGATNVTNTNQLTNGAGFITATLTNEQVQDIVGGMLSGNTESGITVTYQDGDGTIDFAVASQTDNNFTNADHSKLDGIEAGATADQSNSEIKTAYEANSDTNAFTDALLSKLNGIAASATNVTNNNQLTNGAGYITATLTNEQVQDIVGGMVSGNTETGITVTYQDGDGTLDFVVGTLNQDTTGNAATATALETARTIGGVSFNGTANINLPGVNTAGNQNTSGTSGGFTAGNASNLNSGTIPDARFPSTLPAVDGSNLTGISAGATGGGSDEVFYENDQTVTTNYTITNGKNAMAAGPITVNSGVTVTVGSGETLTIV